MKIKLTTLLFGLLLAVGWTSNASAQALPEKQSDFANRFKCAPISAPAHVNGVLRADDPNEPCGATYKASGIKDLTYTYWDAQGNPQTANYVVLNQNTNKYEAELVTDPYKMYGLIRGVYMEKELPGPTYSAYKSDGTTRERKVYYGGIDGGWNIPGTTDATYDALGNITITVSHNYSFDYWNWSYTYYPVLMKSIKVMSGNTVVTEFDIDEANGTTSTSWTVSPNGTNGTIGVDAEAGVFIFGIAGNNGYISSISSGGTFTVPASLLTDYHDVQVVIEAYSEESGYAGTISVNGSSQTISYGTTATTYSPSAWAMHANMSGGTRTPGDILITTSDANVYLTSITVQRTGASTITWTAPNGNAGTLATNLPEGWYSNPRLRNVGNNRVNFYGENGAAAAGSIRIPASVFEGCSGATITVGACGRYNNSSNNGTLQINYDRSSSTSGQGGIWGVYYTSSQNYSRSYTFPLFYQTETYKPEKEGYTAILVAVKNDNKIHDESNDPYNGSWEFSTRQEVVDYLRDNVEFVKLLTDGLRIGNAADYSRGTVFNCDATVNKFFVLGKGQARQRAGGLLGTIATGDWGLVAGKEGPFDFMYEEFSPTTGDAGSQIEDFYSEMMKGNVYNVVHDCASVIQQRHQFSLSGNTTNPEPFSFTGLNFFIPDYRLMYWNVPDYVKKNSSTGAIIEGPWSVDGRDMNPYIAADANDKTGEPYRQANYFDMWFGQYNTEHAPQIGIYRITLDANAEKSADYNFEDPSKRNYDITLHWVSSLDEMAGHPVDQIYTLYTWDENGNRIELHPTGVKFFDAEGHELTALDGYDSTNPFVVTQVTYSWPQKATSQIFEYQVEGTPNDNEHPGFVATSNTDYVVIPGWNDFLALTRNHYESDFVVNEEKNYYRNFLTVANDNEDNALTVTRIANGEDTYTLYRYDVAKPDNLTEVAELTFSLNGVAPANAKYVTFGVSYADGSQDQLRPSDKPLKYNLGEMGVKTRGDLCIHGNGDLVIQPNGTTVNFHSITVTGKRNDATETITSWNESMGTTLPSGWLTSPGSVFDLYEGVYYLEGHGYIYIPSTMLTGYTDIAVTIEASGDAGSVSRITVNDVTKRIDNGAVDEYTWTAEEVASSSSDLAGMIRMGGLPLVDQFSASTAKNDHPERYGYVLIYKKGTNDEKQSSKVEVPVQHTNATVNGFYTEQEVKDDTDRELKIDIVEADVTLNLSATNSAIYHYILLSDDKNVIPVNDEARTDYVSYLQRRGDFTYREMNESSPLWVEENSFGWPAGEREYFNNAEGKLTTGTYGDFKTYVPVVETTGYDRRWYDVQDNNYGDMLHNTYGSPIWKTSAGKVEIKTADAQPQQGWNTTWTDNGNCRLYMLDNVEAHGYLPKAGVTNIEYEPYMFRIFVESENGNLRHFKYETNSDGNKVITADEGSTTGPWCVWSEYIKLDQDGNIVEDATTAANGVTLKPIKETNDDAEDGSEFLSYIEFHKDKVERDAATEENPDPEWDKDANNAIFGAIDALASENTLIDAKDLKVFVRFYYRSTGEAVNSNLLQMMLRADGEEEETPEYYAAEGDSQAKQTPTGVSEVRYLGEIVSQTYFNVQGMQSDKPFDGVNIVVTRYSDGATSISKVVR